MAKKKKIKKGLVGKFFHSIGEDGLIKWQGHILDEPQKGLYLIQCFDWIMGEPREQFMIEFDKMRNWLFYDDAKSMRFECEYGNARRLTHGYKYEQEKLEKERNVQA